MSAYYNEIEPYAAQWLRNLIKKELIADGEVDTRSIVDVRPADLAGFTQCHFFAGIGGWSHALRLAGWPDDRPIWTGSCPCQPFSVAGKGAGVDDPRHLWPHFHRLISSIRPPVVMGEQVAAAVGKDWLDGVCADLEGVGYACGATVVPACAVDAPHRRDRLWFVADSSRGGDVRPHQQSWIFQQLAKPSTRVFSASVPVADADSPAQQRGRGELPAEEGPESGRFDLGPRGAGSFGSSHMADASVIGREERERAYRQQDTGSCGKGGLDAARDGSFWSDHIWLTGADGKARRAQPSIPLLAHGIPNRVGKLRAYGNAIVPQVAAEVIGAYLDAAP